MAQQRNGARGAIWMAMLAALVVLAALAGPLAAARTALAAQATATPSPTTRATPQPTARPVARGTATPAAAATLSAAASGLDLYKRMGCVGCHRLAVANGVGTFGPTHEHIATIAAGRIAAADYSGSATTVAGYLAESIVDPEAYVLPGYLKVKYRMPPYTFLKADEVAALVAFLEQQK